LSGLRFYADIEGKKPIKSIEWKENTTMITLIDGTTFTKSAYKEGDIANAKVYLKNEGKVKFGITAIRTPQTVKFKVAKAIVEPQEVVGLDLIVKVREGINEVLTKGITVEGYEMEGVV
jgi:hypothetical protein